MRISKILRIAVISALIFASCGEISTGLQRRKFEYLYKLTTYGTIFREYTTDVIYFNDLELYIRRMDKLFEDVNRFETVSGWGRSAFLKEEFLNGISANKNAAVLMLQRQAVFEDQIKNEIEVIRMREVTEGFMKLVEDEIAVVGRE